MEKAQSCKDRQKCTGCCFLAKRYTHLSLSQHKPEIFSGALRLKRGDSGEQKSTKSFSLLKTHLSKKSFYRMMSDFYYFYLYFFFYSDLFVNFILL